MVILVTCFEPFGNDKENSSQKAVELLPDKIEQHKITKLMLPVSFSRSPEILKRKCSELHPDVIIMTGQAARGEVCLERRGVNMAASKGTDNDGFRASGEIIYPDAPPSIVSCFPVDELASKLSAKGFPVRVSESAGTFVCNRLYYEALLNLSAISSLFIHIPLTPAQAKERVKGKPSLPSVIAATVLSEVIYSCSQYKLPSIVG
ncbi:MAG: pyroglutamyl-peptidase I [Bacteroidales bacterium]|nr:pyroglutamyl-peptidase I [Bacteroidales bacterium]